jgi:hypothetical protein
MEWYMQAAFAIINWSFLISIDFWLHWLDRPDTATGLDQQGIWGFCCR